MPLATNGRWFRDENGRALLLRGVNLSGNAKLPLSPHVPSHVSEGFFDAETVSFVGRPFPLAEADAHFIRLKRWGFNFLRFNVTWEALEHAGPGSVDHDFIAYVVQVLLKAKQHGFKCFIDPHQDVWSRFTGGSGAPYWTLTAAGLVPPRFATTEAAIVHNTWNGGGRSDFPRMIWPTNHGKLACATMFTLFFGGSVYAPRLLTTSPTSLPNFHPSPLFPTSTLSPSSAPPTPLVSIQDALQHHFMSAFFHLHAALVAAGLTPDTVLGIDTLNEPHFGFIGLPLVSALDPRLDTRNGNTPTALEAMALGEGIATDVDLWALGPVGFFKKGRTRVDPGGASCWTGEPRVGGGGAGCVWKDHGVWERAESAPGYRVVKDDYFATDPRTGEAAQFVRDFWMPFVRAFGHGVRQIDSMAVIFVEPPVNTPPSVWERDEFRPGEAVKDGAGALEVDEKGVVTPAAAWRFKKTEGRVEDLGEATKDERICFAPHWYDDVTLVFKEWNGRFTIDYLNYVRGKYSFLGAVRLGETAKRRMFGDVMDTLREEGHEHIGMHPTTIGEFGVPFDLDQGMSYRTPYPHDYRAQTSAIDYNLSGLERALVDYALWNYCGDNTHTWGDGWNGEDLSVFCADERAEGVDRVVKSKAREGGAAPIGETTTGVIALRRDIRKRLLESAGSAAAVTGEHAGLSLDDLDALDLGGRGLDALIRPYPICTPGDLVSLSFYPKTRVFRFSFSHATPPPAPLRLAGRTEADAMAAEIFMPRWQYPDKRDVNVQVSAGKWEWVEEAEPGEVDGMPSWDEMASEWKVGRNRKTAPRFRCSAGGVRKVVWRCGCWGGTGGGMKEGGQKNVTHEMLVTVGAGGSPRESACCIS
ncbi:glycoside hydrolase family 5 protein [Gonapodya prolifera JEL478]|uniref:Glycoside hydrolase family 5 protein n=1 Tax=Gonapodya prolifera (strain JEL478) TaxID=1344416 RepID=A0A139ATB1_GONPJ|nr:glycoside hydrolase family 5 protein [Gonapodya prolifera JEL478]|eukprot:KXS19803.1 glycoside hydrolase family 5 protein [Gonapodya prolifera JEL478]